MLVFIQGDGYVIHMLIRWEFDANEPEESTLFLVRFGNLNAGCKSLDSFRLYLKPSVINVIQFIGF